MNDPGKHDEGSLHDAMLVVFVHVDGAQGVQIRSVVGVRGLSAKRPGSHTSASVQFGAFTIVLNARPVAQDTHCRSAVRVTTARIPA